jgi:hypothetical protein
MSVWTYFAVTLCMSVVVGFYGFLAIDAVLNLVRVWRETTSPKRLTSGGTGSSVAVPSTEARK